MFKRLALLSLLGLSVSLCTAAELQDPTRPYRYQQLDTPQASTAIELKLQQIMRRNGHFSALIDGHRVLVGQQLGEFRVKAIHARAVLLEKSDTSVVTLSLFNQMKKQ